MANNVFGGRPNAVVAKETIDFVTAGLNNTNIEIIYECGDALKSWVPGRPINAISGFTAEQGYYMVPKIDLDLSAYVVPPLEGGGGPVGGALPMLSTFTAANGTLISDYTPDNGSNDWAAFYSGTGDIQSNEAQYKTGHPNDSVYVYDIGVSDNFKMTVMATVDSSLGDYFQVFYRVADTANLQLVNIQNGSVERYVTSGGTSSGPVDHVTTTTDTAEHTWEFEVVGTTLTVKRDGTTIYNAITIPSGSGTKVGFGFSGSSHNAGRCKVNSIAVEAL